LLEAPEFGNLLFSLLLCGRIGKRFRNGLALHFVSQPRVWAMRGLTGPVTTAVRFAAAANGVGNRSAAEITQTAELAEECGAA